jgi:cation diffusion facilitator CzcD-associated flavoprotein CzcO
MAILSCRFHLKTACSQDNLQANIPGMKIVIVGAGIAGLAAAIGLNRAGFIHVVIHESAKDIAEVSIPGFCMRNI